MKLGRYEVVVQIVGTLGVIASLLFVGFEIKQSRDIAMADITNWASFRMKSGRQRSLVFQKIYLCLASISGIRMSVPIGESPSLMKSITLRPN